MLGDDPSGVEWGGAGREVPEGWNILTHLWLIPIVVWQKQAQHCKTIILQLKKILVLKSRSLWTLWEKARVG